MKLKKNFKEIFNVWIESSTVHGVPNIFRNKNLFLKSFWIICVLSSSCYCIFNLTRTLSDFFDYKVNTKIENQRLATIQFPTISFCNKNRLNLKKYGINTTNVTNSMMNLRKNALKNYQENKIFFNTLEDINFNLTNLVLEKINSLKKFSFDIDEMLINCQFNRIECTKDDFEYFMLADYGNCYKFNSGKDLFGNKTKILDTKTPGYKSGLRLEIFTGSLDKDIDLVRSSGIHLFIHNHTSVIFSEYDSISLSNGFETDIVVSQEHSSKLSKPYSQCIKDTTSLNSFDSDLYKKTIKLFGRYQQKTCLIMCYHEYIKGQCGCYSPDAIGVSFNSSCNNTMVNCSINAFKIFQNSDKSLECFDLCPDECEVVNYHFKMSQANFPSPFYADLLLIQQNSGKNLRNLTNYEMIKESVLAVNIYHDDISLTIISETPAKDFFQLVSDIGGVLGICIGMSVLSFVEIFDLLFKVLFSLLAKDNKNKINFN